MSVEEAVDLVGVTKATGYAWLKRWNSKGYEGLKLNHGGGALLNLQKSKRRS